MSYVSFENVDISYKKLENADDENDFIIASVNIANEIIKNTYILLSLNEGDENKEKLELSRNEAIVFGFLLRSVKLFQTYMELICNNRGEAAKILLRSFLETIVNVQYLMNRDSNGLFNEYIKYSLRTEKELYQKINETIEKEGNELPIENRMTKSILKAFDCSGFSIDDIDLDKSYRNNKWAKITLKKKCEVLLNKESYLFLFKTIHHSVHGNWQSLINEDLKYNSDSKTFSPIYKHSKPRPQHILTSLILYSDVVIDFIEYIIKTEDIRNYAKDTFQKTRKKAEKTDDLHEQYIQTRNM